MIVYRIVQNKSRTADLSGTGAFRFGGRWNSKGTYMLYTSENSSLAYLETLVHFDKSLAPPRLFIMQINIDGTSPTYTLPDEDYPPDWLKPGLSECQLIGDKLMADLKHLVIKVKSAINPVEYNYLLNPVHPGFTKLVTILSVNEIDMDGRLIT